MVQKKTSKKTSKKNTTTLVEYKRYSKAPTRKAARKGGPRTAEELRLDMSYRKEINRRARTEELRNMFKVKEYIRQLELIDADVGKIFKDVVKRKRIDEDEARAITAKVSLLKEKKDLQLKRIAKVVGDVKSVELTDGDGKNPMEGLIQVFSEAMSKVK